MEGEYKARFRPYGHQQSGGVSCWLGRDENSRQYERIDLAWTVHSDTQASLHLSWNGKEMSTIEECRAFAEALGKMLARAEEKRAELGSRALI